MPNSTIEFTDKNLLRQAAEASLMQGTPPPTKGWAISPDALALLFKLASNPDSASDALKLLHELQTHQVELDLQHEQLQANEQECSHEQQRYKALYERAPFGYFVVSVDGHIIQANHTGAKLLGADPTALSGISIGSFICPASQPILSELLMQLREDDVAFCEVKTSDKTGALRQLQVFANIEPGDNIVLLAINELKQ